MAIQWFPGHMARARREVSEKLKIVDVVIELLDARIPLSSRNPLIDAIVGAKPRLVLLNKKDLADPEVTGRWVRHFSERGLQAHPVDSLSGSGVNQIPDRCMELATAMQQRRAAKGLKPRPVRAMILGIPNVGKSSLINRLAGRSAAKTGDRPGVTKAQQWIRTGDKLELLDTPGILWPKFEDQTSGYRLAATGAIKDEILDMTDIALFVLDYFRTHYPERLLERYKLDSLPEDKAELLAEIGRRRGCLLGGGRVDLEKAAEMVVNELRKGRLGPFSLEDPRDLFRQGEE